GLDEANTAGREWLAAAASAVAAAVIINTVIGVFLAIFFAALSLSYSFLRERRRALVFLCFSAAARALGSGILLINYVTTGLLNDLSLRHAWTFANVEKLYQWGALPRVLNWQPQLVELLGVPFEKSINFLNFVLRLHLLWPLVLGGLLVA